MNIITLDFETFFTDAKDERGRPYSLSHLSTEDYVRHPWFEAHGCAIRWNEYPDAQIDATRWYIGNADLPAYLMQIDWSTTACLCHHAHFDGLILAHHYGVRPKFWFDTLSMARLLLGNHLSASLDSVRRHFGIPLKTTPYSLFKGKHWHDLSPAVQQQVAEGAIDEVNSIWLIFKKMMTGYMRGEL